MNIIKLFEEFVNVNESYEVDINQLKLIFADFLDDGATIYSRRDSLTNLYSITIEQPIKVDYADISNHIQYVEKLKEMYLDIQTCINRVKDEFPNVSVMVHNRGTINSRNLAKIIVNIEW